MNREPYVLYDLNAWGDDPKRSTVNDWISQTDQAVRDGSWLVLDMYTPWMERNMAPGTLTS